MINRLRSVLFIEPLILLLIVSMASISFVCSFFDPEGRIQFWMSRMWARIVVTISGVRLRVRGLERLDPRGNYVFIGNHLSFMDTPVVLAAIRHPFLFLVNIRYVKMPFLGTHLQRAGHFGVDTKDTRAGLKTMTEAARRIQEKKLSVLIFPEGTRARGPLQEFKEGAAYIAIKSGTPVIPFALRGTREVVPIGTLIVTPGPVDLIFGNPIPTEGLTLKDRGWLTTEMRNRVAALLEQLEGKPGAEKPVCHAGD